LLQACVPAVGCGAADFSRGTGLLGLKDRVEDFGGRVTLDSRHGAGTVLRAELPLTVPPRTEMDIARVG
jgi:signal transduction histidine kinase